MTQDSAYASASLYVGDLKHDVTEALLFERFNAVGPVASVRVCRDAATRRSLGYAYLNFHRVEDAERALDTMNFVAIRGQPCRIMWSHRDPALRKSGLGNIFVKNLAPTIDNKSLYDTFSMFGNILSCKVSSDSKGKTLGYGFVHYETKENAENAISRVNGKVIAGQKVEVALFTPKTQRKSHNSNIYVKNIPLNWTAEQFVKLFEECGTITSNMLACDDNKTSKGFGFINFSTAEEAQKAVTKYNDFPVDEASEKKLYVALAQKKSERERGLRKVFEQRKAVRQSQYTGVNLYIKNLHDDVDDAKLRSDFSKYGEITSAKVMYKNGQSRGFGFVCFANAESATRAVTEQNGKMVDGKPLYVAMAQRKDLRQTQLEAQFAARAKVQMREPMYHQRPPPQQMFYQHQPRVLPYGQPMLGQYPAPMPSNLSSVVPAQMMRQPYQLMPAMANNNARAVPRQRRQQTKPQPNPRNQTTPIVYNDNARNHPMRGREPNQPVYPNEQGVPPLATIPRDNQQGLTAKMLADAPEEQKKQMIGEHLFPKIRKKQPQLAGKITGMLLEMDNGELIGLLESDDALADKVEEALQVLREHETKA